MAARPPNSFRRSKPRYQEQPRLLVICEDTKSGLDYLKDAKAHFRVNAEVEISHCGHTDPQGIVENAIKREKGFDQVFCVIDRDNHPSFAVANQLAKTSSKVNVIASFPCFEFWLLLHFGYCRKPYLTADSLIEDLRKYPNMNKYAKGNSKGVFAQLYGTNGENFFLALQTARKVLEDVTNTGEPNPSTELCFLLDLFDDLSCPLPIPKE